MKNTLNIGTRVRFSTSRDSGVVTDQLGDGMVMVMLDAHDIEIPAFVEDLMRADTAPPSIEPNGWDLSALEAQFRQQNTTNFDEKTYLDEKKIPNQMGVFLVVESEKNKQNEVESMNIHLLNATDLPIIFEISLFFAEKLEQTESGNLAPACLEKKLSSIYWDELNDSPNFHVRLTPVYTEGNGVAVEKMIRIRPQSLQKNRREFDFWYADLSAFLVVETFNFDKKGKNDPENLKNYTKNLLDAKKKRIDAPTRIVDHTPNVQEFANFQRELDLHIEMLEVRHRDMNPVEIINAQLRAAERFVDHATRLGLDHVFLIHGIGKGRLRELLAARLRRHPHVRGFKNEYHEKYGWGATQVFFK